MAVFVSIIVMIAALAVTGAVLSWRVYYISETLGTLQHRQRFQQDLRKETELKLQGLEARARLLDRALRAVLDLHMEETQQRDSQA